MKPVYVKIDDYKDIIDLIHLIRRRIEDAKKTLRNIDEIKNKEDKEVNMWHTELADMEKRIGDIDRILEEPQEI